MSKALSLPQMNLFRHSGVNVECEGTSVKLKMCPRHSSPLNLSSAVFPPVRRSALQALSTA